MGFGVLFWGQGGPKMVARGSQDGLKSFLKKDSPPLLSRFGDMSLLGVIWWGLGGFGVVLEGFWGGLGWFWRGFGVGFEGVL